MSLLWPHVRESGLRNMGNFCLWDPESGKNKLLVYGQNRWKWNQKYSSRNLESLWLESRIQALLTETEIKYLQSQIQNPRLSWIPLHEAATVFFDKASGSKLSQGALTSIITWQTVKLIICRAYNNNITTNNIITFTASRTEYKSPYFSWRKENRCFTCCELIREKTMHNYRTIFYLVRYTMYAVLHAHNLLSVNNLMHF